MEERFSKKANCRIRWKRTDEEWFGAGVVAHQKFHQIAGNHQIEGVGLQTTSSQKQLREHVRNKTRRARYQQFHQIIQRWDEIELTGVIAHSSEMQVTGQSDPQQCQNHKEYEKHVHRIDGQREIQK